MSTIKVTTIQDTAGGNSSTSEEIYNGRAKAWVNFNGQGTVAARADFNVNSIGDNGSSGDYTVNFLTSFADANYAMVATSGGTINSSGVVENYLTARTTGLVRLYSNNAIDSAQFSVAIFR